MSEVSIIGLDIAKSVFQVHGADASGRVLLRKKVSRAKLLEFFAAQPPCQVVLEACGGAHHWARELAKLRAEHARSAHGPHSPGRGTRGARAGAKHHIVLWGTRDC